MLPPIISVLPELSNDDKIKIEQLYSKIYFSQMQDDLIIEGLRHIGNSLIECKIHGERDFKIILTKSFPSPYEIISSIIHSYKMTDKFNLIPQKDLDELNAFMLEKINHEKKYLQQIDSAKAFGELFTDVMYLINNANEAILAQHGDEKNK